MTVHEMTLMALAEVCRPAHDALAAAGPSGVGYPRIGLVGFMRFEERVAACRAARLAHEAAGTPKWEWEDDEELARSIRSGGSWRSRGEPTERVRRRRPDG